VVVSLWRRVPFISAIVYVLRTGCQWKALPKGVWQFQCGAHAFFKGGIGPGSPKTVARGAAEYDEMEGTPGTGKASTGPAGKAPLAG